MVCWGNEPDPELHEQYDPTGALETSINAGDLTYWESFAPDVTTDLASRRRVRGGAIDFGAFEYHGNGLAVVVR